VDLGEHPPAGRRRLVEQLHVVAPHLARLQPAEHAPGDRAPGVHGQIAQADVVLAERGRIAQLAADGLAGQLEDPRVQLAHHAHQAPDLVPRGQTAGDRPGVGCFVDWRAGGGEAHGARADGVA
jgi:hypothetical protein